MTLEAKLPFSLLEDHQFWGDAHTLPRYLLSIPDEVSRCQRRLGGNRLAWFPRDPSQPCCELGFLEQRNPLGQSGTVIPRVRVEIGE